MFARKKTASTNLLQKQLTAAQKQQSNAAGKRAVTFVTAFFMTYCEKTLKAKVILTAAQKQKQINYENA